MPKVRNYEKFVTTRHVQGSLTLVGPIMSPCPKKKVLKKFLKKKERRKEKCRGKTKRSNKEKSRGAPKCEVVLYTFPYKRAKLISPPNSFPALQNPNPSLHSARKNGAEAAAIQFRCQQRSQEATPRRVLLR